MFLVINGKRLKEEPKEKRKDGKEQEVKELNFTKIEKAKNRISCFINGQLYCTFSGQQKWDNFVVEGGSFTIVKDEAEQIEELKQLHNEEKSLLLKEMAQLKIENKRKDMIAKNLMGQIASIKLELKKGDA